jgi:hypothetical protein
MVAEGGRLWVFGGSNGERTLDDMWQFDVGSAKWTKVKQTNAP